MDPRALVYSPTQNVALWVSAWVHGVVSVDDAQDSLWELGVAMDDEVIREVLKLAREARGTDAALGTDVPDVNDGLGAMLRTDGAGVVRLLLGHPGRPLPAGVGDGFGILTPHVLYAWSARPRGDGYARWDVTHCDPLQASEPMMPGEADFALAQATRQATSLVDALQPRSSAASRLSHPRLIVGTLTDFYEAPGIPPGVTPRAEKLIARANRVSAIIETLKDRVHDHTLDAQLLPLVGPIADARMAAVAAADREFLRGDAW